MVKICKNCQQEFITKYSQQRYCTDIACSKERAIKRASRNRNIYKNCRLCGFTFNSPTTKTLCDTCYQGRLQYAGDFGRARRAKHYFFICTNCGIEFHKYAPGKIKKSRKNRFCSETCHLEFQLKNRREIICATCGKSFNYLESKSPKYCSKQCRINRPIKPYKTSLCEWCKEPYRYQKGHKYCSPECFRLANAAINMNWPHRMKNNIYSQIEAIVARSLVEAGIAFEHNFYIPPFFADFLLPGKIVIECDAIVCHNGFHNHCEHTLERDYRKDKVFLDFGYTVIRLKENDIFQDAPLLIQQIINKHDLTPDRLLDTDLGDYYMTKQASKELRVSEDIIRRWCKTGALKGATRQPSLGKAWLIPIEEVKRLKIERGLSSN